MLRNHSVLTAFADTGARKHFSLAAAGTDAVFRWQSIDCPRGRGRRPARSLSVSIGNAAYRLTILSETADQIADVVDDRELAVRPCRLCRCSMTGPPGVSVMMPFGCTCWLMR